MVGGKASLSKAEYDVNIVSCKWALKLAKATEGSLLNFNSWNKKKKETIYWLVIFWLATIYQISQYYDFTEDSNFEFKVLNSLLIDKANF